jgi:uncharacterized membrane protein YcaP (DUF421 family)
MDAIVSGLGIYLFLLVLFRITGTRSLAQITTFDAVLILIIAEAVQNGMVGADHSMTNAVLLVLTLLGLDVLLSVLSVRSTFLEKLINDVPTVLIDDGTPLQVRMKQVRVSEDDILENARSQFGIERLDQIKYAVLERNGSISVIPRRVTWIACPDDLIAASGHADRPS